MRSRSWPVCVWLSLAPAQDKPQEKFGPPAVLELLLPAGAKATADGKELADPRLVTLDDLKPTEVRRVKLAVKFPDGTTDERTRRRVGRPAPSDIRAPTRAGQGVRGRRPDAQPDHRLGDQPRRAVHRDRGGRPVPRHLGHGRRPPGANARRPSENDSLARLQPRQQAVAERFRRHDRHPVGPRHRRADPHLPRAHRPGPLGRLQPRRDARSHRIGGQDGDPVERPDRRATPAAEGTHAGGHGRRVQPGRNEARHVLGGPLGRAVGGRDRQAAVLPHGAPRGSRLHRLQPGQHQGRHRSLRRHRGVVGRGLGQATRARGPPRHRHLQRRLHARRSAGHHRRTAGTHPVVGPDHRDDRPPVHRAHGGRSLAQRQPRRADVPERLEGRDGPAVGPGHRPRAADADLRRQPPQLGRRQPGGVFRRLGTGPAPAGIPLPETAQPGDRSLLRGGVPPRAYSPKSSGGSGRHPRSRWGAASRRSSSSPHPRPGFPTRRTWPSRWT